MAANAGIAALPGYAGAAAASAPVAAAPARSVVNPLLRAAFYLFVLSIPFEFPRRSIPLEIPTITGSVFLLATLLRPGVSYRKIPGALIWFVAYLWMFGLSTLVNGATYPDLVLKLFLEMLQVVLIFWAGTNLLRDRRTLRGTFIALAFAVAVRGALQVSGIGATAHEVWTGGERITAFGQNANLSAMIMGCGAVMLLTLRPRLLTWPIAALTGLAIIQTGSRGGLFALTLGILIWAIAGARTLRARLRGLAIGLCALAALAVGVLRSDMLRTRLLAAEGGSLAGREHIYPAALELISEKPILGWGPIENQVEIGARIGEEKKDRRDAHNLVLDLLSATGILGAIPFVLGYLLCWRAALRARHGACGSLPAALLSVTFVSCMSGTWIASKILWLILAIAVATGASASAHAKQATP